MSTVIWIILCRLDIYDFIKHTNWGIKFQQVQKTSWTNRKEPHESPTRPCRMLWRYQKDYGSFTVPVGWTCWKIRQGKRQYHHRCCNRGAGYIFERWKTGFIWVVNLLLGRLWWWLRTTSAHWSKNHPQVSLVFTYTAIVILSRTEYVRIFFRLRRPGLSVLFQAILKAHYLAFWSFFKFAFLYNWLRVNNINAELAVMKYYASRRRKVWDSKLVSRALNNFTIVGPFGMCFNKWVKANMMPECMTKKFFQLS